MHSIFKFYPILSNCLKPNYFLINPISKFENFFKILKKIKFKRSSSGQKIVIKFHWQNFDDFAFLMVTLTIGQTARTKKYSISQEISIGKNKI